LSGHMRLAPHVSSQGEDCSALRCRSLKHGRPTPRSSRSSAAHAHPREANGSIVPVRRIAEWATEVMAPVGNGARTHRDNHLVSLALPAIAILVGPVSTRVRPDLRVLPASRRPDSAREDFA
jgi:hypothetical protein